MVEYQILSVYEMIRPYLLLSALGVDFMNCLMPYTIFRASWQTFPPQNSFSKVGHKVQKLAVRRKPVYEIEPWSGSHWYYTCSRNFCLRMVFHSLRAAVVSATIGGRTFEPPSPLTCKHFGIFWIGEQIFC